MEETATHCPSCGTAADDERDPLRGKTLAGGYVIEKLVGAGAMANVYRAEQTNLRRTVAVKVMHTHLMHDETTGRRFINEARAASRLNHPHSLAVIDFGRMDDGLPYMVMEYLRGRDLERVVQEEGPLSFARVIDILLQLLDALSEAHELDIIHRDLKPENIVIEPVRSGGDFVKVVDFGLAKLMGSGDDVSITATGTVCGTPDFMSPEQCRGDGLDARSDLYAVGINLFVLLTGRVPFEADTPTQALILHLTAPAPDPREIAPDRLIPESLARVTLKALEKDPANRYQSADEFVAALEACKQELGAEPAMTIPSRTTTVRCPACGGYSPAGTKFCVECGAPVGVTVPLPADDTQVQGRARAPQLSSLLSLVGRDAALVSLLDPMQNATGTATSSLLCGEAGVGKTRLVRELAARAKMRGHVVVHVEPDPWMVGVAYYALRQAIRQLAHLPPDGGAETSWVEASDSARQGLREVFGVSGSQHAQARNRRLAVRDALAWALSRTRAGGEAAVVVFDDLQFIDAVSLRAVRDVLESGLFGSTFLIGTHTPSFEPGWPESTRKVDIGRLSPEEAFLVLEQSGLQGRLLELPHHPVTPLYLEQAVRFADDGPGRPPGRLGDLIHQRLSLLGSTERQALQAIAVLGDCAATDDIRRLMEREAGLDDALDALVQSGLISKRDVYRFSHHLLWEVVLNTIPAGVFRDLCGRTLTLMSGKGIPSEARAWLMLGAEEAFEALLTLDQIGSAALARDDSDTAVDAYRRGLEFARADLVRGNLHDPMHAVVVFSRKLGEALTCAGRPEDADGVLREALDFAEQGSSDQAQVLLAVACAAYARTRVSEAIRSAHRASAIARRCGDEALLEAVEGLIHRWGG